MPDNNQSLSSNKALVRDYLNALGSQDTDRIAPFLHPDYVAHIRSIAMRPDTFDGPEFMGFIKGLGNILATPMRLEFVEMTEEDNRVSTIARGFATTVDGDAYNNQYHFLNYIEDGKVIKHLEYMDSFLGAKVLGPIMQRLAKGKS
jgi:uncharacterized protein